MGSGTSRSRAADLRYKRWMTKRWAWVVAIACGCHGGAAMVNEPVALASTAELDALWAMAPASAKAGIVVSPRGLVMLEHAWRDVHGFVAAQPAWAPSAERELAAELAGVGLSNLTLAAAGLGPGKGFALFADADEHTLVLVPVVDRARFLKLAHGTSDTGGDRIDDLTCKPLDGWYACTDDPSMLATAGKGVLRRELDVVGARGEIEAVAAAEPLHGAAVLQLARGTVVARAVVEGLPHELLDKLGAPVASGIDANRAAGFAAVNLAPLAPFVPPLPLTDGVTAADLARSLAGPLTISVAPGSWGIDARALLRDPAPATALIAHCVQLAGLAHLDATLAGGACRVAVPQLGVAYEARVGGKDLRITTAGAPPPSTISAGALGRELAHGTWQLAVWGRGTLLANPNALPVGTLDPDTELGLQVIAMLVNELGLGVRTEGDRVRVVAFVRSAWANPDDVVARLAAVRLDDVLAGRARRRAQAIADAAPRAPFAADNRAGVAGLVVPAAGIGAVAALVLTPTLDTQTDHDRAALAVRRYADEAYPEWGTAHPDQDCPGSLDDLAPYLSNPPAADPWGHPYQMACGAKLPPGAKYIAVWSVGPDGQNGTADDVTSWK